MFTEVFARSGSEILAVDLSPDLLVIARQRCISNPRVRFLEERFENCSDYGPFDCVIGSSVLHHLDLEMALSSILKLLRPGGRMSFAEPNMLNPQVFMERKFRRFFPYISSDETAFVRSRLLRDMRAQGYEDIKIVPFDWLHPALPASLIPAVSRLGRFLERIWPIREFAGSLAIQAKRP
jgi:2-polyprenyl-3-methyl-5-hydroxy-6-metoxy-1,4-benzoquinol methylase